MAGKTISSTVTKPITIGAGGYNSPLTITSTGKVAPAYNYYGATAITVPAAAALVSIINHGGVYGVPGDGTTNNGYTGGNGIEIDSATSLSNTGVIRAGYGGFGSYMGGYGGVGVDVQATSSINNSGLIAGGAGGYGAGTAGVGGYGVRLEAVSTLNNSGTIIGGAGGSSEGFTAIGENAGIGVLAASEATILNSGKILGGAGGTGGLGGVKYGLYGAYGLDLGYGTSLNNSGAITGGAGGGGGGDYEGGFGGAAIKSFSTITNTGSITGGAGGEGQRAALGGDGVDLQHYGVLTNKGHITGGAGGAAVNGATYTGVAGYGSSGLFMDGYAIATNGGQITGGAGGAAVATYAAASAGGEGVGIEGGTFTNSATITGGAGGNAIGSGAHVNIQFAGNGGAGLASANGASKYFGGYSISITNYGLIRGGTGGSNSGYGGNSGAGGDGASIGFGTFSNHGTIIGGASGNAHYGYAGAGGTGVYIGAGARVSNSGTIIGGIYGYSAIAPDGGGNGVVVHGGTLIDSGVVKAGPRADAVYLNGGSVTGTLVLDPGASFSGTVAAAGTAGNLLEVAGSINTVLTGIGSEFTGFSAISFASGATRSIEGSIGSFNTIEGFAAHDIVILDGYSGPADTAFFSGSELSFYDGGSFYSIDIPHATAKDIIITATGGKVTLAAVPGTTSHTIASTQAQFVFSGGTASNSTIKTGGVEYINQGGTAAHTTIAGGELLLYIGGKISGGVSFNSVKGGNLNIESATLPTATISGFIAGDTITLDGIAYNPNDRVTVGTAGTVTIATPGMSYKLDIAGATVGETDFRFSTGSVLTKSTAMQALTFISAPELSTSGTSLAPGRTADFLAFSQHHIALDSLSFAFARVESPTPSAAGALAHDLAWRTAAHTLLIHDANAARLETS